MSTRHLDPPQRRAWVGMLPPHKAATTLLREYLESRVASTNRSVSVSCKAFLRSLHHVMADGNPAGVEIGITQGAERGSASIFFHIPGSGCIGWLPTLTTAWDARLTSIARETSANRLAIDYSSNTRRKTDPLDDRPARRGFPPQPETRLIPGRRV